MQNDPDEEPKSWKDRLDVRGIVATAVAVVVYIGLILLSIAAALEKCIALPGHIPGTA